MKKNTTYSDNAIAIYKRLYFDKNKQETTPEQTHGRVASFIANSERERIEFLTVLNTDIFRPNTPCMINAGSDGKNAHDRQLQACFIIGLEDSMDSIIEMWGVAAKIYASGAGLGIPLLNLREELSNISSGGTASGPCTYSKVIDIMSNTVRSGGKTRRAANLGLLKYNHPDIFKFIESKINGDCLQTFNLSISVDDDFMSLIENNIKDSPISLISPNENKIVKDVNPFDIWNKIIEGAWTNGDPGLFFYDNVNKFNPILSIPIECCNACGEVGLWPWSACNLGSINVSKFVDEKTFDWPQFITAIKIGVRFLDNVIDKTSYLHPKFEEMTKKFRPLGLGIMGFADMLSKMNIEYGSFDSILFFENICHTLTSEAIKESIQIVKEDPSKKINIPESDMDNFIKLLIHYTQNNTSIINDFKDYGIRNTTWTCIAPTGSTSMSADCSYAWEPHMALIWEKPLKDSDEVLTMFQPDFRFDLATNICGECGIMSDKIVDDIIANKGSIQNIPYISDQWKRKYKVAHDIDPITKINMQAAGQKYISMAISSTTNLPNSATKEDVEKIYLHAWKKGLKGITVFRDGCRNQIVQFGKQFKEEEKVIEQSKSFKRPIKRSGETIEINTPHGKMYTTCNYDQNKKPFEIFFRVGKQGALTNVLIDALGRVCSKALQDGTTIETIVDALSGSKAEKFWYYIDNDSDKTVGAESIVDAMAQILDYHFNRIEKEIPIHESTNETTISKKCFEQSECPTCHKMTLRHDTGCRGGFCQACGYSSCG